MKPLLTLFFLLFVAFSVEASRGDLRFSLEPGLAHLKSAPDRHWSGGGASSISLMISDLAALTLHGDYRQFFELRPRIEAAVAGIGASYRTDILWISPVLEAGIAYAWILRKKKVLDNSTLLPYLGLSVDWRVSHHFETGVVFRYYPLFDSDLFDPFYGTASFRFALILGG